MRHALLKSPSGLNDFSDNFQRLSGLPVQQEYLDRSNVYGFRDKQNKLIAGYIICPGAPRYLSFIAHEDLRQVVESRISPKSALEVTCLWAAPEVSSIWSRTYIYWHMFRDVVRMAPELIVSGSTVPALKDQQRVVTEEVVYFGPWKGTGQTGWIYVGRSRRLFSRFIKAISVYVVTRIKKSVKRGIYGPRASAKDKSLL